ncbi:hypothetical protein Bca101_067483 [Brassica carinata]
MLNSIVLGAGMVEVDQSGKTLVFGKTNTDGDGGGSTLEQGWTAARGQLNEPRVEAEGGSEGCRIPVSPSRFQALAYISEEDEVEIDELSEAKEGEIVVDKNEQWCRKNLSDSRLRSLQRWKEDLFTITSPGTRGSHLVERTPPGQYRAGTIAYAIQTTATRFTTETDMPKALTDRSGSRLKTIIERVISENPTPDCNMTNLTLTDVMRIFVGCPTSIAPKHTHQIDLVERSSDPPPPPIRRMPAVEDTGSSSNKLLQRQWTWL